MNGLKDFELQDRLKNSPSCVNMDGQNNHYVDLMESQKSNKRSMVGTIIGKAKESPKDT